MGGGHDIMKKTCNLCGNKVKFKSIEQSLGAQLKEKGFLYKLSDFETLNYKHYACPKCGANDRDRLYKIYFDGFENKKSIDLVDFAPSKSLTKNLMKKRNINYRSADLHMDGVDDIVDITDMVLYDNESFDFFICSHILEHVDDKKAISELYRILRRGGRGIMMTPIIDIDNVFDEDLDENNEDERWRRFAQDDHVRLYSKKKYLERLKKGGFAVRQLTWQQLGLINFLRYGIAFKSVLYIVEKRG
jgi:SAM-dependent methyltransferase